MKIFLIITPAIIIFLVNIPLKAEIKKEQEKLRKSVIMLTAESERQEKQDRIA